MFAFRHNILLGCALVLCIALGMLESGISTPLDNQLLDQQFRLLRQ